MIAMYRKQAATVILPLLLAWLTGDSSEALSSFGVSNVAPTTPPPPVTLPARPCLKHGDCIAVPSSSCVRTHYDPKTRCLCGDNSAPVNGLCEAQPKSLYHTCTTPEECNDGLTCGPPNATGGLPPHLTMLGPRDTICLCDVDNGFREKDHTCNALDRGTQTVRINLDFPKAIDTVSISILLKKLESTLTS